MDKPSLLVVAGCNGSGKSSFSNALTPKNILPFDYDKIYLLKYIPLQDSEIRSEMAHNLTFEHLERSITKAIETKSDFCYETNFDSTPLHWPKMFKDAGFELNLIFFCLDSVEQAKKRVAIRVENGGHHVPDSEVEKRFKLGYENLDKYFGLFDNVHLLDTSLYNKEPQHILTLSKGNIVSGKHLPKFLQALIPTITKLVNK
jgi:predicted ABC-type ATPase